MARWWFVCVALSGALTAQGRTLQGVLLDPSGRPVLDASVQFVADPTPDLAALTGLLPPAPARLARSDRGSFRFEDVPGPGTLLATTATGLGAFAARSRPGVPQHLQLQPMAEVALPAASETFTLWAATLDADGERCFLPPLQGQAVRLPPGSYELWFQFGDAFHWTRLSLRSGQRSDLPLAPLARRLQRAGRIQAHPAGWPQVELFPGPALFCSLRGDAALAPLTTHVLATGVVLAERQPGHSTELVPQVWPPGDLAAGDGLRLRITRAGEALAGATVWLLRQRAGSDPWLPMARAATGQDGRVRLPAVRTPDGCWLLLTAPGMAPRGQRLEATADGDLELEPARLLEVRCTAATAVDEVCLHYEPDGDAVARQRCRTDALGHATLVRGRAPGRILVSDPRFANGEVTVAPDDEVVRVALAAGASLAGHAVLAGDQPATGALVTLRDPRGELRPAERAVVVGADGSFAFHGLPADGDFVLFAQQRRDGRTWSGKLAHARADGSRYIVELRSEDPELPRGDGR